MSIRGIASLTLLACSLSACGMLGGGAEDPPGGRNADEEVVALFNAGIEAFNRHELNVFMGRFGADIRMHTPTGWVNGYAAVRERFGETFAQFPAVRMEVDSLSARQVEDGVVVTRFRWRVYPMGDGPAFHGAGSGVYILRGAKWEEVLAHETITRVDEGLRLPTRAP